MQLRQQLRSSSRLGRLRDRVRSTLSPKTDDIGKRTGNGGPSASPGTAETTDDSTGNLFHCSTCSVVFIAEEKQICSECENEVEQVPSTLSCR